MSESQFPPGWYPDPGKQNELRYFNGENWTSSVSNNGVPTQSPLLSNTATNQTQNIHDNSSGNSNSSKLKNWIQVNRTAAILLSIVPISCLICAVLAIVGSAMGIDTTPKETSVKSSVRTTTTTKSKSSTPDKTKVETATTKKDTTTTTTTTRAVADARCITVESGPIAEIKSAVFFEKLGYEVDAAHVRGVVLPKSEQLPNQFPGYIVATGIKGNGLKSNENIATYAVGTHGTTLEEASGPVYAINNVANQYTPDLDSTNGAGTLAKDLQSSKWEKLAIECVRSSYL